MEYFFIKLYTLPILQLEIIFIYEFTVIYDCGYWEIINDLLFIYYINNNNKNEER